ncbi:hypothetical protein MTP04_02190 [Lysinibacillus sp. PLM2]|nr:hypothetical protein MTP04_02190 [Lysinibacillus sp. PLM2]
MSIWNAISNVFKPKYIKKSLSNQNDNLPLGDYQKALEYEIVSTNPKFNRTTKEEDLVFNFSYKHAETLGNLESAVYVEVNKIQKVYDVNERMLQCKKALESYEKLKSFCLSKGKGGKIHFEDMWEHCHNSKNPDFRFIESVEIELDYLLNNKEEAEEKLKNIKLKVEDREKIKLFKENAKDELIQLIAENYGILQKNIYQQYDDIYKPTIKNTIKNLCDLGIVERVKEGNNYKLYLK